MNDRDSKQDNTTTPTKPVTEPPKRENRPDTGERRREGDKK